MLFALSGAERKGDEWEPELEGGKPEARTFDQLSEQVQAPKRDSVITVTAVKQQEMEAPESTRWQGGWTECGGERTPTLVVMDAQVAAKLKVAVGTAVGVGRCKEKCRRWVGVEEKVLTTAAGKQKEKPSEKGEDA